MQKPADPLMNQPEPRSWWSRNWKWVVPVGCLTPIIGCGGCFSLLFMLIFGVIKSSDAYTDSLAQVRADLQVQQLLGMPIKPAFFVTGSINVKGSSGHADIAYDVSGPHDTATVYAVAQKSAGSWTFTTLIVEIHSTGQQIDLLTKPESLIQLDRTPEQLHSSGRTVASLLCDSRLG